MVEATCAEQGLPVLVTDRAVLLRVSTLLGMPVSDEGSRGARRRAARRLGSPGRAEPVDVDRSHAGGRGQDLDVLDECLDDRDLAAEVEPGPLLA